jgi:adenylate kinase family enzyme
MKRAETSGRADDNAETIKKRVQAYFDSSLPVIGHYKKFGKVHHINALGTIEEVYAATRKAIIPEVMWLLGAKASGKTTVGHQLATRTNMKLIDFNAYLREQGLSAQDDETKVSSFISSLSKENRSRIIVENFP